MFRKTIALFAFLFAFIIYSCNPNPGVNDYSSLPQDTANYLTWGDQLQKDPDNAELLYKRAQYLYGKNQIRLSLIDAEHLVQVDSSQAKYFYLLGNLKFLANKTKESAAAFEKAVQIDPEDVNSWLKLAELYQYVKEHKRSLECTDAVLKLQPENSRAYFLKGMNYSDMQDKFKNGKELAMKSFQKAIELDVHNYDALMKLGILTYADNPRLAVQYFKAALQLKPTSLEALYGEAYAYQQMKNYDSAAAVYKRYLEINNTDPRIYFNIAHINLMQKNLPQAIEGLKTATRLDADYADAYYNLGLCYIETKEKAKAIEAFQNVIRIEPDSSRAKVQMQRLMK